ncbi:MAG: hypothetical protein KME45_23395 [Stenomitos rutilans HA7619-LM2]|jgi:multidrug resistance efflux pump|nr:hypothetical protein [Stenomitos rutilans HA7619-LM2]
MEPEYWLTPFKLCLAISCTLVQPEVGRSQRPVLKPPSVNTPGTIAVPTEVVELSNARKEYQRYQQLYQEGAVSRQQLDQAESNYKAAQRRYNQRQQSQRLQRSELERASLEAELAQAEAYFQERQRIYQRAQSLYQEGAIERQQLIRAEQYYKDALTSRETLRQKLRSQP